MTIRPIPNFGPNKANWSQAIDSDGNIRQYPVFLDGAFGRTLTMDGLEHLIAELTDAHDKILAAHAADKLERAKPKLPTEPGLYVHPRMAADPASAEVLKLAPQATSTYAGWWVLGQYEGSAKQVDEDFVRDRMQMWGGLERLVGESAPR